MKVAVLLSRCGVYDGSEIHESVFSLLALAQKKLEYVCIALVIIARSLEKTNYHPKLTVGSVREKYECEISEINDALSSLGSKIEEKSLEEISVDNHSKIISAPCYMLGGKIEGFYNNIRIAVGKLSECCPNKPFFNDSKQN